MKVGFYQFRPRFGKPMANLRKVIDVLKEVSADLIVLPELAFSGYYFASREEASALAEDPVKSDLVATLATLCKERNLHLVTGFAEKKADKIFNSSLLIGPDGLRHTYRKLHLFNDEKNWFDPGDTPLQIQHVLDAKIGMMICFDWFFPEVARTLAVAGAHIICHPSNLVLDYCQQAMLTRCLESSIFAITANRFGTDKRPHGELRFTGKSQIVAPRGKLLQRAPSQREMVCVLEIDPALAENKMITPLNHQMTDRRPEFYK